ncbi:exonuclease III [Cupriavidus metallidurans]
MVCLQELKAVDESFPAAELHAAGYGAVWQVQKSWNGETSRTRAIMRRPGWK